MNCPKCNAENPASNRFCDECGTKLAAPAVEKKEKDIKQKERPAPMPAAVLVPAGEAGQLAAAPAGDWLRTWFTAENLAWLVIFLAAAWLRLHALGDKPLHHDESLHAFYSWNLFQGKGYHYDPMMHGPFQFHGNALMYILFGASNFTCRLMAVSCSLLCVGLVYLLRPHLGKAGALFAGVMMAISPSFTYFGRFTREDAYYAAFTLLAAYGLMQYLTTRRARDLYIAAAGLALAFCTKEAVYITGYIFASFLVFRWLWEYTLRQPGENHVSNVIRELQATPKIFWTGLAVFFGIMIVLYTTFFTNPQGIIDAFTKSLTYWLGQHEVQRGSQPVYFYAALLPLYEQLAVVASLAAFAYYGFIKEKNNRIWRLLGYLIVAIAWWLFAQEGKQTFGLVFSLLLITLGTGLLAYFSYGPKNLIVTFLIVWTIATFSDMSFAGERMPWLIIHPLLPMVLLSGLFIGELWERFINQRAWILGVFILFAAMLLHGTTNLCFYEDGANPAEQLVYVQTSTDVPQVVRQITNMSKRLTGGTDMKITCEDYCSWPFAWYLREFKFVGYPKFTSTQVEGSIEKTPVIITGVEMAAPGHDDRVAQLLAQDYIGQRYKLRVWWAPDSNAFFNDTLAGQFNKAWELFFYRRPWSGLGSYDMVVYVRKDVAYLYWSEAKN